MTINTSIKSYSQGPQNVDFYRTMNATTPPTGYTVPLFELLTQVSGENGTEWMYVKASSAIKAFDCVSIDENGNAASITNALARTGCYVGAAQVAFASGDYGWVALQGSGIQVRTKGVLRNSGKVYCPASASGSAGVLRASATARLKLQGLRVVSTVTGSGTGVRSPEAQMSWPLFILTA